MLASSHSGSENIKLEIRNRRQKRMCVCMILVLLEKKKTNIQTVYCLKKGDLFLWMCVTYVYTYAYTHTKQQQHTQLCHFRYKNAFTLEFSKCVYNTRTNIKICVFFFVYAVCLNGCISVVVVVVTLRMRRTHRVTWMKWAKFIYTLLWIRMVFFLFHLIILLLYFVCVIFHFGFSHFTWGHNIKRR